MTVRLSERLNCIASLIGEGESVCDIGTDHGFLPIYLARKGGHDPLIMTDVSRGSLDKAVADAEEELGEDEMPDARLGDGLDPVSPGEVEDIVIAGMGGIQILDILAWDFVKTLTYRKYILQPRRDAALLRKWLETNRFTITEECIVPERERFSEIICAGTERAEARDIDMYTGKDLLQIFDNDPEELAEYEYPDDLRDPSESGAADRYFRSELAKIRLIERSIAENSGSGDNEAVLAVQRARIRRLEILCGKMS